MSKLIKRFNWLNFIEVSDLILNFIDSPTRNSVIDPTKSPLLIVQGLTSHLVLLVAIGRGALILLPERN